MLFGARERGSNCTKVYVDIGRASLLGCLSDMEFRCSGKFQLSLTKCGLQNAGASYCMSREFALIARGDVEQTQ